jgi:hypothetical protein
MLNACNNMSKMKRSEIEETKERQKCITFEGLLVRDSSGLDLSLFGTIPFAFFEDERAASTFIFLW